MRKIFGNEGNNIWSALHIYQCGLITWAPPRRMNSAYCPQLNMPECPEQALSFQFSIVNWTGNTSISPSSAEITTIIVLGQELHSLSLPPPSPPFISSYDRNKYQIKISNKRKPCYLLKVPDKMLRLLKPSALTVSGKKSSSSWIGWDFFFIKTQPGPPGCCNC